MWYFFTQTKVTKSSLGFFGYFSALPFVRIKQGPRFSRNSVHVSWAVPNLLFSLFVFLVFLVSIFFYIHFFLVISFLLRFELVSFIRQFLQRFLLFRSYSVVLFHQIQEAECPSFALLAIAISVVSPELPFCVLQVYFTVLFSEPAFRWQRASSSAALYSSTKELGAVTVHILCAIVNFTL